ncbi:MAG: glycosyl hydrolase family 65 protein [Acidimicrobiales bacterium]
MLRYKGRRLAVTVKASDAAYELVEGDPIQLSHHGQDFELTADSVAMAIPEPPEGPRPAQPHGREPLPRHGRSEGGT